MTDGKALVDFDNGGKKLIPFYDKAAQRVGHTRRRQEVGVGQREDRRQSTVEVSHPDIKEPVAVRYNWADNPQGDLYSEIYLPAYPFRTDDWDGVTKGKLAP